MNPANTSIKVYIAHHPSDKERLERLIMHMAVMIQEKKIEVWHREVAMVGDNTEKEANAWLERADLVLYLISPDYLASKFYHLEASKKTLAKLESRKTHLVTIYLRPCDFKHTSLYEFETMLSRDRPLIYYIRRNNQDQPYSEIVDRLWKFVEDFTNAKASTSNGIFSPTVLPIPNTEAPFTSDYSAEPKESENLLTITAENLLSVPILPDYYLPREEELAGLVQLLLGKGEAVAITGVKGMGGIGKSVLAAAAAEDERVKARFPDGIFWLVLGQTPDLIRLQTRLAQSLGDNSAITTVEEGKALLKKLLSDKVCLLVLDDIWEAENGQALALSGNLGKTLVTTREEKVVTRLGAEAYNLDKMSPTQALGLLARAALVTIDELPPEAADVAKECGYLPLALSIAGAMAYDQWYDWADVLQKLKENGLDEVFKNIEVSLEFQPDLIEYYLDMAVFPEDAAIPLETLQVLWRMDRQETEELAIRLVHASLINSQARFTQLTLHDLQFKYVKHKRREVLSKLNQRLLEGYRKACGGVWWYGQNDGYFYERLGWHLREAGQEVELKDLLLDYRWIEAKLKYSGANSLPGDYAWVSDDKELKLVGRAISQSVHVLAQDTRQLANQLTGRLMGMDLLGLKRLVAQAQGVKLKGFRLLSPTLIGADSPLIRTFEGHTASVKAVAITPDGTKAISAYSGNIFDPLDPTLKLWDLSSGQCLRIFQGHAYSVTGVVITPDGTRVISASEDTTLKLWDLSSGQCLRTLVGHAYSVTGVVITPDGTRAISVSEDTTLKLWDLSSGQCLRTFRGHVDSVTGVAITPDGTKAISGSNDKTLKLWDLSSRNTLDIFQEHIWRITGVAITPDGTRAISASEDTTLKLWDLRLKKLLHSFEGHAYSVTGVAITPDGTKAISGSKDRTLRLWDLSSGKTLRTINGRAKEINAVAIIPGGTKFIFASEDGTFRLCDFRTGKTLRIFYPFVGHYIIATTAVAITTDGTRAISGSQDGTLKLWDLRSKNTFYTFEGHNRRITGVAITPDGTRAISASEDGTLKLWDLRSRQIFERYTARVNAPNRIFRGHTERVNAVAITPDGTQVISASNDKTLRLWDLVTGNELASLPLDSPVLCCTISWDGRLVVAGDSLGNVHFLRMEI